MSNYIHGAYGKPKGINTTQRIVGKSAYEIAVEHGFVGSEEEWLESLKGKSAYEVAVDLGYEGTADEWVESIGMAMGIDLVDELTDLKDDLNQLSIEEILLRSELPGTTQTVTMDSGGNPTSIVHSKDGTAVRTDAFTWSTNSVVETRTADGKFITITTNLVTLASTISEIQEVA